MKSIIRNYLAKLAAGRTDDGIMITLPDPKKINFQEAMIQDLLMRNGVDPNAITSEEMLKGILNQIDMASKQTAPSGIRGTRSAQILDMEGQTIPQGSKIMGGKAMETEAEIAARLEAQNKDSVQKILDRKNREDVYGLEDYDTTNMSDIQKEIIRTETKLGNLNPDSPGFRERAKSLIDKIEALKNKMRDDKADGGRIGYFMGSQLPKGLATLREMIKFFSKGKEKERSGSEILRMVNPKQFNKLLEDPNIYRKFDVEKGIGAPELIKNMQADMSKNRTMMVEEILNAAKNIKKADVNTMESKKEMIEEMIKRGIDRETAEEMANTISTMAEASAGMRATPKLTDEGMMELENILKNMETGGKAKRDLNADGGRIGLKDGMNRRTFLKLLGGLASIPIIGKIIKPLKTVKGVKNVPIIKTDNVPGKPEWFDQLVNKVIIEGDDVTKRFATKEREIVHTKDLGDGTTVRVTQDMDQGAVRVEYESEANVFGDPVQMEYKKPLPDEDMPRGGTPEFTTAESGPVGRRYGPDDYEIEVDEVGGSSIMDLDSDVSKLKEYATGKKPTMKEIVQNKKRKDKAKQITEDPEAQSDAVIARQGEVSGEDYMYASGGIARMLGE